MTTDTESNVKENTAEWIEEQDYMGFHVCSCCGYKTAILHRTCPNCGKDMRVRHGRGMA